MLSPELATIITALFYLAASVCGVVGLIVVNPAWRKAGCWLALTAFACQTVMLVSGFHSQFAEGLSPGAYLQLLAWFLLLGGIGAWLKFSQDAILLFSTTPGFCIFLLSLNWLTRPLRLPGLLSVSFYALHIGALFVALALLTFGFMAAVLFLVLQKRIKTKKKMAGAWGQIPALSILEKIISFCALACYPLYTIGLAAGLLWATPVFGSAFTGDLKEIISIFIWLLLTWLFYKKVVCYWKGKKPALLIVIIFILSFLSVIIVNLVPSHHGFIHNPNIVVSLNGMGKGAPGEIVLKVTRAPLLQLS